MYNKDMFWDNVKTILSQNKILQKDFADKLGYNLSTLKNQMARNISPSVDEAVKIAQALNTTVEYLVTGEESNKDKQTLETIKTKLNEVLSLL